MSENNMSWLINFWISKFEFLNRSVVKLIQIYTVCGLLETDVQVVKVFKEVLFDNDSYIGLLLVDTISY